MALLASHWDACHKESSVWVVPPLVRWQNITLIPLEVKSALCTRWQSLFLYQERIWGHLEMLMICWDLFLPASGPDQRSNRQVGSQQHGTIWWQASHPSSGGLMPCRLSRRCWTTPHVSMATVPPANINYFFMSWILWPCNRAKEDHLNFWTWHLKLH